MTQSASQLPQLSSAVLHNTLEAVILVNQQGIVLDWNAHAETIFGWSRLEIIGRGVHALFMTESFTALWDALQRLLLFSEASERHYFLQARHQSGERFTVEVSLQILSLRALEGTSEQMNFCLFVRDVEQFKDAYIELRKRERRYRILSYFSSSVFGDDSIDAVLWDIAQNCIAELEFEDAVVYWLDGKRGVLIQKAAFGAGKERNETVLNPIDIPLGRGIVGAVAVSGIAERIADTSQDARYIVDDAIRFSELTVPIVHKGVVLGVIDSEHSQKNFFTEEDQYILERMAAIAATKIVRIQAEERVKEINERLEHLVEQRTQELRVANSILEEKNQALSAMNRELDAAVRFKTEMLSIAAHDLKNPLGVILSSAELMADEIGQESPMTGFAQRIAKTSRYMLNLISSLLDAAAIDLGQIEMRRNLCVLSPIIAAVCDSFHSQARTKGQSIFFASRSLAQVMGDEERLFQVFENIISNAVKYSPLGKQIWVTIEETESKTVRVAVRDEGQGLSDEDKQKIFGFFQRLSARPTAGETSNGVGLAIVKKIVELHQGTIQVISEVGKGATFIVELPKVEV